MAAKVVPANGQATPDAAKLAAKNAEAAAEAERIEQVAEAEGDVEVVANEAVKVEANAAAPAAAQMVPADGVQMTKGLTTIRIGKAGAPAKADDDANDLALGEDSDATLIYVLIGLALIGGGIALFAGGESNAAPVAGNDTFTTTEGAGTVTFSVATNDSDPDGDALTFAAQGALPAGITLSPAGQISLNASAAEFDVLAAGATRVLSFSYTATDAEGLASTATVSITVTGVNDAPVVANLIPDQTVAEDTALTFVVPANTFTDVDTATLTLTASLADGTALPAWLTFNAATRTFSGTPPLNFNGSIDVRVTASDGPASVNDVFRLTVTPVNDAPVVANAIPDVAVNEDTAVNFTVAANAFTDVDSAALTLTAALADGTALPSWLVFNAATRTFSGTPPLNFNGALDIRVTASDGALSANDVFRLTVNPVNDAPVVGAPIADQTVAEDTAVNFTVPANTFTDVDNAALTLTATLADGTALPSWLTFNAATRTFTGTPPLNFNGAIDVRVTASDGALSVSDDFRLTVTPVNDAPVVANPIADQTVAEDTAVNFTVPANTFTDVDSATLTLTATLADGAALPSWLTFNATTRAFTGTPPLNFSGAIDVRVTASDGALSVNDVFRLTVTPVNDAPVVTSGATATVNENAAATTVVYTATATDVDAGDTVRFSLTGANAGSFTIDAVTGEVRLREPANFERTQTLAFTVVATDSGTPALTNSREVTLTVVDQVDVASLDVGTATAAVTINAGIQTGDTRDTNFRFVETAGAASEVRITNFGANDFIFFDGSDPADYTFQNDGNGNLVISSVGADGEAVNVITLANIGIAANNIVVTERDAEAALAAVFGPGDYFRGSSAPATVNTTGNPAINGAGRALTIIEDLGGPESSSVVTNFRSDDILRFINGPRAEVSFTTGDDPRDLRIDYVDRATGNVSTVILDNVLLAGGPIVFDEASAEAAVALVLGAGDYFQFG